LYIIGPDTPDGQWTEGGGVSNGTAHGVYSFLEEYVDVRWLMPGDLGRDVPKRTNLSLPAIDRTFTPAFNWRRLTHLWDHSNYPQHVAIMRWMDRQRLGGATVLDYDHNMWRAVNDNKTFQTDTPAVKELYAAHPEWFAMNAEGKRPYPTRHYDKLEMTNPELKKWFAAKAVAALKASPRPRTFSLSPSDGRGWSQSPESKALYDPSPTDLFDPEATVGGPGMSSMVFKWYHDIAALVQKEYPQGKLAGYIYGDYLYPPSKMQMKLPDNFLPVIVPSFDFGYRLYREDTRSGFNTVFDKWGKVAPENWYYYDLPNQFLRQHDDEIAGETSDGNFPGTTGLVSPPAPSILNTVFAALNRNGIKGVMIYGVPSWSNAALSNYMLAKMQWNPKLNAYDLQREWLHRAYGTAAGGEMEKFYARLEEWTSKYYQANVKENCLFTRAMLQEIYAANYPEMEALYLEAKKQPMSEVQRQRLNFIEENLMVLQWRLRNAGLLAVNFTSPLQRNDAQIHALITSQNPAFSPFPGADGGPYVNWQDPEPLPWKVQAASLESAPPTPKVPGHLKGNQFLIHATRDGELRIITEKVVHGSHFASFQLRDGQGVLVKSGILHTAEPIVVGVKAGSNYVLTIPSRKSVTYQLRVENGAVATGDLAEGVLSLHGKPAAVSVFHQPAEEPSGIYEEGDSVVIKKPFRGAVAQTVMGDAYINTRVLHEFDTGWKFSPDPNGDGEARGVLQADFDDSKWATVSALDWWQMQGFPDYRGVAWYRIKFNVDELLPVTDRARLYFGGVDGHATIYVNGHKFFERPLPADFSGWDRPFSNQVNDHMKLGENIIAVKVTSKSKDTASGIFKGAAIVAGTRKQ
jgi:hypothetical protein